MGSCMSSGGDPASAREAKRDREIERQFVQDRSQANQVIKLLLLGAGESGKSTIFKQMKILYGQAYTREELSFLAPVIYRNMHESLLNVLEASRPLRIKLKNADAARTFKRTVEANPAKPVTGEFAEMMKNVWADPGVKKLWSMRSQYQVVDSLGYFMSNIERIAKRDYVPSQQDVLNTRVRTSGIVEERYTIQSNKFLIVDVGGQRNERKKWIHSFEGVTAVLFVAAINEYDQTLFEDSSVSRIGEAVKLFDDVCNNAFFKKTTMILFLNKRDLFEEKLFKVPLRVRGKRHEDFQGPYAGSQGVSKRAAIDAATAYMTRQFTQVNRQPSRTVFAHVVSATDSGAVRVVFDACRETILRDNLANFGFMDS